MRGVLPGAGRGVRAVHGELELGGGREKIRAEELEEKENVKSQIDTRRSSNVEERDEISPVFVFDPSLSLLLFLQAAWLAAVFFVVPSCSSSSSEPWPRSLSSSAPVPQQWPSRQRPRRSRRRRRSQKMLLPRPLLLLLLRPPPPRPPGRRRPTARETSALGEFAEAFTRAQEERRRGRRGQRSQLKGLVVCSRYLQTSTPTTLSLPLSLSHPPLPPPPLSPRKQLSLTPLPRRRQFNSFKTLEGGNANLEIREYAPATWSTTSFPAGTSWSEIRSKGFDRNFKYIQGAGVAMTAPVVSGTFFQRRSAERKRERGGGGGGANQKSLKLSLFFKKQKNKKIFSSAHPPLRRRLHLRLLPRPFEIREPPRPEI